MKKGLLIIVVFWFAIQTMYAQVAPTFTVQGRVTSNTIVPITPGVHPMVFIVKNPISGLPQWNCQQDVDIDADGHYSVALNNPTSGSCTGLNINLLSGGTPQIEIYFGTDPLTVGQNDLIAVVNQTSVLTALLADKAIQANYANTAGYATSAGTANVANTISYTTAQGTTNLTVAQLQALFLQNAGTPIGFIGMWGGSVVTTGANANFDATGKGISSMQGWALCNGQNGTTNLRDKFVIGGGNLYSYNSQGGANSHTHTGTVSGHTNLISATAHFPYNGSDDYTIYDSGNGWRNNVQMNLDATNSSKGNHTHEVSIGYTTNSTSNLPPYIALAYIQRIN